MSITLNTPSALLPAALSIPAGSHQPSITDGIEQDRIRPADGFGKRLKGAMREAGLTPAKLGKRVNLPTTEIKDILSDGGWCSLEQVRLFAAELGADMTWLWLGRGPAAASAAPATLTEIAVRLEEMSAHLDRLDAADNVTDEVLTTAVDEWWTMARKVPGFAVINDADIRALARICRTTWHRTHGDPSSLRDELDQKLHQAVIAQASRPSPDARLLNVHDWFLASQLRVQELSDHYKHDDDSFEAAIKPIQAGQWLMIDEASRLRATTLEGVRARVRMWLADDPEADPTDLKPGVDSHLHLQRQLFRDLFSEEEIAGFQGPNNLPAFRRSVELGRLSAGQVAEASSVAAASTADAELITLHNRFIELEGQSRELGRTIEDDGGREKAREPLAEEQDTILNRAWELTATTLEGHRARARMLLSWDAELKRNGNGDGGINDELSWLLVRDLLGEEHADALQSRDLDAYHAAIAVGRAAV